MILTILVGNTNTRLAWWQKERLRRHKIVPTTTFRNMVKDYRDRSWEKQPLFRRERLAGTAIASVVPALTRDVYNYFSLLTPTVLVSARTPVPLRIRYNRTLLGTDRLCAAVGGYLRYARDLVILDFGTAITVNIVHREGVFLGGPIIPGIQMMLSALKEQTAQLPAVRFSPAVNPLVQKTTTAIQSGVCHLVTGGLNRIITLIARRTKREYFIVATGGGARTLHRHLPFNKIDPHIASFGLAKLFYFNRRKNE